MVKGSRKREERKRKQEMTEDLISITTKIKTNLDRLKSG